VQHGPSFFDCSCGGGGSGDCAHRSIIRPFMQPPTAVAEHSGLRINATNKLYSRKTDLDFKTAQTEHKHIRQVSDKLSVKIDRRES